MEPDESEERDGAYLVGTTFNPSGDTMVDEIKQKSAELIDLISSIDPEAAESMRQRHEQARCQAEAITHIETAAMFAVKAATKRP